MFFFNSKKQLFKNLMAVMKLDGFYLVNQKKINNGHVLTIGIPPYHSFSDIEKKKENFESYFKGIIEMEQIRFSDKLTMKIITQDIGFFDFEPVKTKSNEFYIGKLFDGENYFIDLNKDPHVLIAGKTGTGKSFLLASILTNLIYNHSNRYDIYLCQTAKRDIDYLKNCKGIKMNLYTPSETAMVLEDAVNEIDRRSEFFANNGFRGIDHYNSHNKTKKMKRKLYVFEEISLYMPDDTDSEEEQKDKNKVWQLIWKIVKLGRESGIHFMGLTQRTTVANLGGNGEIKSQLTRITFAQATELDSRNVIDCDLATKLQNRECYILGNNGLKLVKVPTIDKGMTILNKYVPEIICVNSKNNTTTKRIEFEQVQFTHTRIKDNEKSIKLDEKIVKERQKSNRKHKKGVSFDDND